MKPVVRVTLAVLGFFLFAALLFPAFRPVRENWHDPRTGCASNMKQLGLAFIQYEQDNNETLPDVALSGNNGWREKTFPYVKSVYVYRCPDDQRDSQDSPDDLPTSYAANALCLGNNRNPTALLGLSPTAILVTDTRGSTGEDWDITSPAFLPQTGGELYTHKPSHYFYEHPIGTLNLLFIDGHVKAMKPDATLEPINLWTPSNAPFVGQNLTNARAILTHAGK